jgi:hypothetical protein
MISSNERWALYIDIEGIGSKWNETTMDAFRGINALMQGIFRIGDRYYRARQTGSLRINSGTRFSWSATSTRRAWIGPLW